MWDKYWKRIGWPYWEYRKRSVLGDRNSCKLSQQIRRDSQNDQVVISSYTLVKIKGKFEQGMKK